MRIMRRQVPDGNIKAWVQFTDKHPTLTSYF